MTFQIHILGASVLRELVDVARSHREMIERAWHDDFG